MTHRHLIEHIHVRCGGLIVHHPAAIRELQLTARHEGTNQVLCFGRLLMPPRGEKSLFYLDESSIRGCSNRWHDGVQYVLNGCGPDGIVASNIILRPCLLIANIIMRMGYKMNDE